MDNYYGSFDLLKVIEKDYCIGCGTCTTVKNSPVRIVSNENGQYQAYIDIDYIDNEIKFLLDSVCPFSNTADNEDVISKKYFSNLKGYNKKIGYYDKLYAGYVNEGEFRKMGSSGGFGSWVLVELLRNKLVDEIIHVKEDYENKFKYSISSNIEEVKFGAKSRYYPVEMSGVLDYVKGQNKKFAIVGIPCFIKSIRLLTGIDDEIRSKIKFTIGLVCGHLKSSLYTDMLAWKMGIDKNKLFKINFREKVEERKSNEYSTKITIEDENQKHEYIVKTNEIYGTKWSYGFFKYNACDFCDDVVAETSDITVGDAWLPEYNGDSKGTNIIISRNQIISELIKVAEQQDRIKLNVISEDKIITSQEGGFRHRHEGLSYRLYLKDKRREWHPTKRHKASRKHINIFRRLVYRLRIIIRQKSFKNFKKSVEINDIKYFDNKMKVFTKMHDLSSKLTWIKIFNIIKSKL